MSSAIAEPASQSENHDQELASRLIEDLARLRGSACANCRAIVSARDALANLLLGFGNSLHCLDCLARRLQQPLDGFRESILLHIRRRRCYLKAWNWAGESEGEFLAVESFGSEALEAMDEFAKEISEEWDAGDRGCGELALELRMRMERLTPGAIFKLTTRDLGAREDVPAWCGLVGHELIAARPPDYWMRRKQ